MSKTYNNIPMTEAEAERVAATDAAWTGPKLVVLTAITLAISLTVLWLAADGSIGPSFTNTEVNQDTHDLQISTH